MANRCDYLMPHAWVPLSAIVVDIQQEIPGVATYYLALRDHTLHAAYHFQPGQFNMLYIPGVGEIAISISSDAIPSPAYAHTIRQAGNVTTALSRMQLGEQIGLRGPFGVGWPMAECAGRDVVLVAGGIGLAPLRPVIYALAKRPSEQGKRILLYGARSPDMLLYHAEYAIWQQAGWSIETTVDRADNDWNGNVGAVTLLLDRLMDVDMSRAVLFCCGPEIMMKFTVLTAFRRGWPAEKIWLSMERHMQCAVGWCGHCQWGPTFVCRDGPVFRYDRIQAFLEIAEL